MSPLAPFAPAPNHPRFVLFVAFSSASWAGVLAIGELDTIVLREA